MKEKATGAAKFALKKGVQGLGYAKNLVGKLKKKLNSQQPKSISRSFSSASKQPLGGGHLEAKTVMRLIGKDSDNSQEFRETTARLE